MIRGTNPAPYVPTPKEISARARVIREEVWVDEAGIVHTPWDETTYQKRAGLVQQPLTVPMVSFSQSLGR